ncbi:hypothetical protein BDW75DRAFT_244539 [Aspergillus navahoensis]
MGGRSWTAEEDTLLIYLASIRVTYKNIVGLFALKGFTRTESAIQSRAQSLRETEKLGHPWNWDVQTVDKWLDKVNEEYYIETILVPTAAELDFMKANQPEIDLLFHYTLRTMTRAQQHTGASLGLFDY